jgi:acetolactate synthase-1/2/3 large subunit
VLGLPEDMLSAAAEAVDAQSANPADPAPSPADMAALAAQLAKAERPLMIVGGPGWSRETQAAIETFAARFDLPVAAAFRYQDYIDNRHANYVGHAGIGLDASLAAAIKDADLLIVIGARLGEMTTSGYALLNIPNPAQTLVHVHPSPDELGSVYRADIAINSSAGNFVQALGELATPDDIRWSERTKALRSTQEQSWEPLATPGDVQLAEVIRTTSEMLPEDAIVCNGAGNYAAFLHRYFQYKGYRTQLAPTSGSMGYGLPAAIGAKIAHPERTVVAFAGDGCFMMTGQELATVAQYGLGIVIVVVNNGMFGTIRMHQERHYPERVSGTTLMNPDFAAYGKAFGVNGVSVTRTQDFQPALAEALASNQATVIEVKTDPEAITARQTLTEIRDASH